MSLPAFRRRSSAADGDTTADGAAQVAAPPAVVDPCAAPLAWLLEKGSVAVDDPDGRVTYYLMLCERLGHPVAVEFSFKNEPPGSLRHVLNPGWHWPHPLLQRPALDGVYAPGCSCSECLAALGRASAPSQKELLRQSQEVAGLAVLNAIMAGLRVWALHCGTHIGMDEYVSGPPPLPNYTIPPGYTVVSVESSYVEFIE